VTSAKKSFWKMQPLCEGKPGNPKSFPKPDNGLANIRWDGGDCAARLPMGFEGSQRNSSPLGFQREHGARMLQLLHLYRKRKLNVGREGRGGGRPFCPEHCTQN